MSSTAYARRGSVVVFGLAVLLLLGALLCIVGSRNGWISYIQAFTWLRYLAQAGAVVFLAALVAFAFALRARGTGTAFSGLAAILSAVLVGTMYFNQASPPAGPPFINDITTDLEDPPEFDAVVPLRPPGSNSIEYGGPETAANQRRVHPEVEPVLTGLPPDKAYERALEIGEGMGWNIVARNPDTRRFEAIATTTFFRFKDDIVVRVRPTAEGSRVDLRSHSRVGASDLGKNAARIMEFRDRFMNGAPKS